MGQSKVSYHMKKLKDAGLVREERRGKWSFYSLDREAAGERLGDAATACSPPPRGGALPVAAAEVPQIGVRVLFLCTHNSARSQMAEGLLRQLAGDRFEPLRVPGTEATHVRPLAVRAMDEIDVDISGQESKTLDRYLDEPFDYVITVCDDANEACPFFPGAARQAALVLRGPLTSRRLGGGALGGLSVGEGPDSREDRR